MSETESAASEISQLLTSWLADEYKFLEVQVGPQSFAGAVMHHNSKPFSTEKPGVVEYVRASVGQRGPNIPSILFYIRGLEVAIHIVTPKARSRAKEVHLAHPDSITDLQAVVRHVISTTLPATIWLQG